MKVICIDAELRSNSMQDPNPLVEGQTYVVESEFSGDMTGTHYYGIQGYPWIYGWLGHSADRFVVLKDEEQEVAKVEEMEMSL